MAFAHATYDTIAEKILTSAAGALRQANQHTVFFDYGLEHWGSMSVSNSAHAGELFIKAAIASVHPLLVFQNTSDFANDDGETLEIEVLVKKGRSHDFAKLPSILWAACGYRIGEQQLYNEMRDARNAMTHFINPGLANPRLLSANFIYRVIDPLINRCFGMHAIEYHEDYNVGYDYIVDFLLKQEIRFSMPEDFDIAEISISEAICDAGPAYRQWITDELTRIEKLELLRE